MYALLAREVFPSQLEVGGGDVIGLGHADLDAARRPDDPENHRVGQRLRGAAKMTPCDCTGTMSTFPATPVTCHGAPSFITFLLHACAAAIFAFSRSQRETLGGKNQTAHALFIVQRGHAREIYGPMGTKSWSEPQDWKS